MFNTIQSMLRKRYETFEVIHDTIETKKIKNIEDLVFFLYVQQNLFNVFNLKDGSDNTWKVRLETSEKTIESDDFKVNVFGDVPYDKFFLYCIKNRVFTKGFYDLMEKVDIILIDNYNKTIHLYGKSIYESIYMIDTKIPADAYQTVQALIEKSNTSIFKHNQTLPKFKTVETDAITKTLVEQQINTFKDDYKEEFITE